MADFDFESGASEASSTFPAQASSLRKGGHIVIRGRPCKIKEMNRSQPGKHGHAKLTFVALDIFTGKKLEYGISSTHNVEVPNMRNVEHSLINISGEGFLTLMNKHGVLNSSLRVPENDLGEDIRARFERDEEVLVTVLSAMGEEMVVAAKTSPTKRP